MVGLREPRHGLQESRVIKLSFDDINYHSLIQWFRYSQR